MTPSEKTAPLVDAMIDNTVKPQLDMTGGIMANLNAAGPTGIAGCASGAIGPISSMSSPYSTRIVGVTGVSFDVAPSAGTPKDYWAEVAAAYNPPVSKLDEALQKDLTKELLQIDPSTSMAVEEEINYAKYQTQIKEKAEEFLKSFDKGKFAKKADDQKTAKLEELKQKIEDLKKDRETQSFAAELVAEHKKSSPPPLDVFALNRCAFNVDIKDFLRWSSEDAQQVKLVFDQYVDTGLITYVAL
jgi:hypothetical protein